jgi:hypothetical protein
MVLAWYTIMASNTTCTECSFFEESQWKLELDSHYRSEMQPSCAGVHAVPSLPMLCQWLIILLPFLLIYSLFQSCAQAFWEHNWALGAVISKQYFLLVLIQNVTSTRTILCRIHSKSDTWRDYKRKQSKLIERRDLVSSWLRTQLQTTLGLTTIPNSTCIEIWNLSGVKHEPSL